MADPRIQGMQQTNPIQQDIRKNALKRVARLLNDYYQSMKQQVTPDDLKKETFGIVKEMDQIAKAEARDEADYNAIMNNQYNNYKQLLINKRKGMSSSTETDPVMMATVMINSLQKLQDFMDRTEFQPHDFKLIQQLIQFIKSIPSDNFGVHINQQDQIEAIKVYYDKLFLPIQKTIENQELTNAMMQAQQSTNQNQMATTPQQQQMMQQMIQQGIQPTMQQQLMQQQQQQQLQRPQITPSMSQQMPSPSQDMNAIPRQMPVPTPQNPMSNALQAQPSQGQKHPGLSVPMQQAPQGQQSQQQMQQIQQIQQQQSTQQLQQVQQHQNPRSPQQQKARAAHPMTANSPQMMQQQQQPMHGMNMPVNQMQPQQPIPPQAQSSQHPIQGRQPTPGDNSEIIKQLFQNVRGDCAVFYSTPHPPHF